MDTHKPKPWQWAKTIFWGIVTTLLYTMLFSYSDAILHMAHTTPESCVVLEKGQHIYYHKVDIAACTAMGGHVEAPQYWHVLIPILIAFAISLTHGAFTGLFWDVMGLKPANRPKQKG
jgi:hypothetical protein